MLLSVSLSSFAVNRNWRINPDPEAKADFTSINAAMNDERVIPGDFLILDPGYYDGTQTVTKENITISGPGYFLSQNYNWPDAAQATIVSLNFKVAGKVQGCYMKSLNMCDNLEVFRCKIDDISDGSGCGINIEACYIAKSAIFDFNFKSSTLRNNIILGMNSSQYDRKGYSQCTLEYNTIIFDKGWVTFGESRNSVIRNNIIIMNENDQDVGMNVSHNNEFTNNVLSTAPEKANAAYPNNSYVGATVENTFIDKIIADRYYLCEGSPAKGKASDGGDCGAFGGRTPYVISGILQYMPHITNIDIPAKPTDGSLKIKMKMVIRDE